MSSRSLVSLSIAVLAAVPLAASAQQQGVSKNEILVGTIQDLSGPLAGYGKQARNGMLLRIDEGEFGFCSATGEPIGLERLLARPTTTLSFEAQTRKENRERQYA